MSAYLNYRVSYLAPYLKRMSNKRHVFFYSYIELTAYTDFAPESILAAQQRFVDFK